MPVATSAKRNILLVWSSVFVRVWLDISPPPGSPWRGPTWTSFEQSVESSGGEARRFVLPGRRRGRVVGTTRRMRIRVGLFGRSGRWPTPVWTDTVPE